VPPVWGWGRERGGGVRRVVAVSILLGPEKTTVRVGGAGGPAGVGVGFLAERLLAV
jgi:hypothetical protein